MHGEHADTISMDSWPAKEEKTMQEYPLRRTDRQMPDAECRELLASGTYGILATAVDNQPYAVPLSYVWLAGKIYFHCATTGRKLDNLAANQQVCFTVVGNDIEALFADGDYSTTYSSVIMFGRCRAVVDIAEKNSALRSLCQKYLPDHMDGFDFAIHRSGKITAVYGIEPKSITGKRKNR